MKHTHLYIFIFCLALSFSSLYAEDSQFTKFEKKLIESLKVNYPKYSIVNDSTYGKLIYPGERDGMNHFYTMLDSMLEIGCRVNVLHIGGSHVQGGYYSNRIREDLTRLGENTIADIGLLFPFKVLKTNNPSTFHVTYTGDWGRSRCVSQEPDAELGLSGAAAIARDTLDSISFDLKADKRWDFSKLRILGESADSLIYPIVIVDKDTILSSSYDKIGGYTFDFGKSIGECTVAFRGGLSDSTTFILRGFMPETGRDGITYSESGVNGAALPSWLRCSKFKEDLSLLPPDLVIFGIGINDANVPADQFSAEEFKANYHSLIKRIQQVSPNCSFLFITNNDCFLSVRRRRKTYNKNTGKVREAFMDLAKEYHTCIYDVYELMGGFKSSNKWYKANLMRKDHIHFTKEGYELLGDILYDALIDDYFNNKKK